MSVNSKMTTIADKIRTLLGLSGTMSLDAMATNLEIEKTNIANAFTAVSNKGGTVPSSQVSGGLATAINSIPTNTGVAVRTASGTISPSNGNATVTCKDSSGATFKPDAIKFSYSGYNASSVVFNNSTSEGFCLFDGDNSSIPMIAGTATTSSNGFQVSSMVTVNWQWSHSTASQRLTYYAVKYTT